MTLEQIEKAVEQRGGRLKARYRDQWGFIVYGVILGLITVKFWLTI